MEIDPERMQRYATELKEDIEHIMSVFKSAADPLKEPEQIERFCAIAFTLARGDMLLQAAALLHTEAFSVFSSLLYRLGYAQGLNDGEQNAALDVWRRAVDGGEDE